jgi:hypothetical protein
LEREPFYSAYWLAEALDVSLATVVSCLRNFLEMKFCLRWVPHQLVNSLRQVMVAKCGEILRALAAMQRTLFRHIITGDHSRFYIEYQHASQWSVSRNEVSQRVDPVIGTIKLLFTAIWRSTASTC